jgi:hypothetical protein
MMYCSMKTHLLENVLDGTTLDGMTSMPRCSIRNESESTTWNKTRHAYVDRFAWPCMCERLLVVDDSSERGSVCIVDGNLTPPVRSYRKCKTLLG